MSDSEMDLEASPSPPPKRNTRQPVKHQRRRVEQEEEDDSAASSAGGDVDMGTGSQAEAEAEDVEDLLEGKQDEEEDEEAFGLVSPKREFVIPIHYEDLTLVSAPGRYASQMLPDSQIQPHLDVLQGDRFVQFSTSKLLICVSFFRYQCFSA
jgi:hypothetical protein